MNLENKVFYSPLAKFREYQKERVTKCIGLATIIIYRNLE
jgi:hypothetical protein